MGKGPKRFVKNDGMNHYKVDYKCQPMNFIVSFIEDQYLL